MLKSVYPSLLIDPWISVVGDLSVWLAADIRNFFLDFICQYSLLLVSRYLDCEIYRYPDISVSLVIYTK